MAKDEFKKISRKQLADDREVYFALKGLGSRYQPSNQAFATTAITALHTTVVNTEEAEVQAEVARETARDINVAAEWAFHNGILGVKGQALAQFGPDSDEIVALGLKKKSERKRPTRKAKDKA